MFVFSWPSSPVYLQPSEALGVLSRPAVVTFCARSMSTKIAKPAVNTSTGMPVILHTTLQALRNGPLSAGLGFVKLGTPTWVEH